MAASGEGGAVQDEVSGVLRCTETSLQVEMPVTDCADAHTRAPN